MKRRLSRTVEGDCDSDISSDDSVEIDLAGTSGFSSDRKQKYGIGATLLAKMGHVEGQGLGVNGQGLIEPLETKVREKYTGLGKLPPNSWIESTEETVPSGEVDLVEKSVRPLRLELQRVTANLNSKRNLIAIAVEARQLLESDSVTLAKFYETFRQFWADDKLGSLFEDASVALMGREIKTLTSLDGPEILASLRLAASSNVMSPTQWSRLVSDFLVPKLRATLTWDSIYIYLQTYPFLLANGGSLPFAKLAGLNTDWIAILKGEARTVYVKRIKQWLADQAAAVDLASDSIDSLVLIAEELAEYSDLQECLLPVLSRWISSHDMANPGSLRALSRWCGAISPNSMAQLLHRDVLPVCYIKVAQNTVAHGPSWWESWRNALPEELQSHPLVLMWINTILASINAYLDGTSPKTIPIPSADTAPKHSIVRSTFQDVVSDYCAMHGIPLQLDPLKVGVFSARIVEDVLYIADNTANGGIKWLPISLDELVFLYNSRKSSP